LADLGINSPGHRIRLTKAIKELKKEVRVVCALYRLIEKFRFSTNTIDTTAESSQEQKAIIDDAEATTSQKGRGASRRNARFVLRSAHSRCGSLTLFAPRTFQSRRPTAFSSSLNDYSTFKSSLAIGLRAKI
jgi:hypothetical protein